MSNRKLLWLAFLCGLSSNVWSQEFPIGIWFSGNQKAIDSVSALNFTWIHAYGGWNRHDARNFKHIVQNNRNLKVIAVLEQNINYSSFAQRIEYQAWKTKDDAEAFNYFKAHPTGNPADRLGTKVWQADSRTHAAGYLVQDPDPNDQFLYRRMSWVATANLSIDPTGNNQARVARLEIMNGADTLAQRLITEGEFRGSTAFKSFEVSFTLARRAARVQGAEPVEAIPLVNPKIDVRVWWYGRVNTYLNYVTLEDSVQRADLNGAYQLFRGQRDADITSDARHFASESEFPLVQRFYLRDEPQHGGYQAFNYVDRHILNSARIEGSVKGRGRGITAVHNFSGSAATFDHFINQAQPNELMIDAYPISADVPAPTEYVPAAEAQKAGIVPFVSATDYNNKLQSRFDGMITGSMRPAIQAVQKHNLPWWYVGQLHGSLCLDTGKYRARQGNAAMERPPSPEEIRASINLALAYGAKGIFYFIFHTQAYPDHGGCAAVVFPGIIAFGTENRTPNHSSNYDSFEGRRIFTGYQQKYAAVKALNAELRALAPILMERTWRAAFTSGARAPAGSIVTSIDVGRNGYIEAATFDSDYIMLVNRKCHPSADRQTIALTTNKSGRWLMEDQLTREVLASSNGVFRNLKLNPGQGRLFKLRPQ